MNKNNAVKIKEFRAIEIIRISSKWTRMNIINNSWASKVSIQSLKLWIIKALELKTLNIIETIMGKSKKIFKNVPNINELYRKFCHLSIEKTFDYFQEHVNILS